MTKRQCRPCLIATILLLVMHGANVLAADPNAQAKMDQGAKEYQSGAYARAVDAWDQAAKIYADQKDIDGQIDAAINISAALQMLGEYERAVQRLDAAMALGPKDAARKISILNGIGSALTMNPDIDMMLAMKSGDKHDHAGHRHHMRDAESVLNKALALATESNEPKLKASVLNNLGNCYLTRGKTGESGNDYYEKAARCYRECADIAKQQNDGALNAKAQANAALAAARAAREAKNSATTRAVEAAEAKEDNNEPMEKRANAARATHEKTLEADRKTAMESNRVAIEEAQKLSASSDQIFVLITAGKTAEELANIDNDPISQWEQSEKAYEAAAVSAQRIGDVRSLAYAYGYLGHISELRRDYPKALQQTRRALLEAQKTQLDEISYRWQWQIGRILKASGEKDDAILAYKRAVAQLKNVRNDIALGHGNQRASVPFRESIGPIYFELADLLLERAGKQPDEARLAESLKEARETVELLKGAELEDFFKDECVNLIKQQKQRSVDELTQGHTAIIYIVPLKERTELLVTLPASSGRPAELKRVIVPVKSEELAKTVLTFRKKLVYFASDEYQIPGKQLYDWLIAPIEDILKSADVGTLAFVPDGPLRTIPMSALYDGQKHLIEKYAVAVTPGLDLMESTRVVRTTTTDKNILMSGLSEQRGQFPALWFVPVELDNVHRIFGGGVTLLNENFVPTNVKQEVLTNPSIVHIASHGHFGGTKESTYLITHGENMTLDDVEKLIRPLQLNGKPVELLTLSACQTAEGDDRAALGLAGIAVKAGARSSLATLWCVNDGATSLVISDFYKQLHEHPEISKAQALQRAQIMMVQNKNPALHHPFLWAPYLIIGNWQ